MIRLPTAPKAGDKISAAYFQKILRVVKASQQRPSATMHVSAFRGGQISEAKR